MQTNRSIEPPDSADPGVVPWPVDVRETSRPAVPRGESNGARGPLARLLSVLRGDKYMADAYEPEWSARIAARHAAPPPSVPTEH
jgi:hypothetical protein